MCARLRRHTFEISDRLKDGSDVVEVPDCRAYADVTLRLWSPTVRFVEFRPAPGNGKPAGEKPQSLTRYLHNVVPSGERRLIDGGELCYRIRIDKAEEDACDAQP